MIAASMAIAGEPTLFHAAESSDALSTSLAHERVFSASSTLSDNLHAVSKPGLPDKGIEQRAYLNSMPNAPQFVVAGLIEIVRRQQSPACIQDGSPMMASQHALALPLPPITVMLSPFSTVRFTPRSTWRLPKLLCKSMISIIAMGSP
jgi:hypothetical protein